MPDLFWKKIKGNPNQSREKLYQFFRAMSHYAKHYSPNGIDPIQELAIRNHTHAFNMIRLTFKQRECKIQRARNQDGRELDICRKHGNRMNCNAIFNSWFNDGEKIRHG